VRIGVDIGVAVGTESALSTTALGYFWSAFRWVAVIASALVLFDLTMAGYPSALSEVGTVLLQYFSDGKSVLLDPMEPFLGAVVAALPSFSASGVSLFWLWQDSFILFAGLFASITRGSLLDWSGQIALFVWIVIAALLGSCQSILNPLAAIPSILGDHVDQTVADALWSMVLFAIGSAVIGRLTGNANSAARADITAVALIVAAVGFCIFWSATLLALLPNPFGFVGFALLFLGLVIAMLIAYGAAFISSEANASPGWVQWTRAAPVQVALDSLSVPAAAAVLLALNAGLSAAGA
jgi:hypothetical protein